MTKRKKNKITILPTKRFLWWHIPVGWKKLGKVGPSWDKSLGKRMYRLCGNCSARIHAGTTGKTPFIYCPKCFMAYSDFIH